ncbi:MAG: nickel/cobalt transporter [Chitinivibrionales bacterium]
MPATPKKNEQSPEARKEEKEVEAAREDRRQKTAWSHIPFADKLLSLQRNLTGKLSGSLREIKTSPGPGPIIGLLLMAFIYGVIHSLGPGHAKVLFMSHTLSRPTPVKAAWGAGTIFSATHTGMAILIFLVLRKLLGLGQVQSELYSSRLLMLSGVLIMVAGAMVLFSSYLEDIAQSAAGRIVRGASSLPAVAVVAGLAPCPGAFLILTFSSIIGILHVGILAVVAVSLGMALTVSVIGSLGGVIGGSLFQEKNRPAMQLLQKGARFLGGAAIVLIGAMMVF